MKRQEWLSALLRSFLHWLYHEGAWAYDGVAALVSAGRWVGWVMRALDHVEGELVLEIGHGPGHLLAAMVHQGLRPVGLDLSLPMARRARRRTGSVVPLAQGRAQALPFPEGTFDVVVTTFPAPFILEAVTWQEVARVLRPGGRFVALLSAWPAGPTLLSRAFRALYRWTFSPDRGAPFLDSLYPLAQKAGMALREWSTWDGPWHLRGVVAVRGDR